MYEQKIKAIENYLEAIFNDHAQKNIGGDYIAENLLTLYKCCDLLNIPNAETIPWYGYPKVNNCGIFMFNEYITLRERYSAPINSSTHYKSSKGEMYVDVYFPSGMLAFGGEIGEYYGLAKEWENFSDMLISYKPCDYDIINNHYIYEFHNGKKLIEDWENLEEEIRWKISEEKKKIQKVKKREQLQKLQKELEEM